MGSNDKKIEFTIEEETTVETTVKRIKFKGDADDAKDIMDDIQRLQQGALINRPSENGAADTPAITAAPDEEERDDTANPDAVAAETEQVTAEADVSSETEENATTTTSSEIAAEEVNDEVVDQVSAADADAPGQSPQLDQSQSEAVAETKLADEQLSRGVLISDTPPSEQSPLQLRYVKHQGSLATIRWGRGDDLIEGLAVLSTSLQRIPGDLSSQDRLIGTLSIVNPIEAICAATIDTADSLFVPLIVKEDFDAHCQALNGQEYIFSENGEPFTPQSLVDFILEITEDLFGESAHPDLLRSSLGWEMIYEGEDATLVNYILRLEDATDLKPFYKAGMQHFRQGEVTLRDLHLAVGTVIGLPLGLDVETLTFPANGSSSGEVDIPDGKISKVIFQEDDSDLVAGLGPGGKWKTTLLSSGELSQALNNQEGQKLEEKRMLVMWSMFNPPASICHATFDDVDMLLRPTEMQDEISHYCENRAGDKPLVARRRNGQPPPKGQFSQRVAKCIDAAIGRSASPDIMRLSVARMLVEKGVAPHVVNEVAQLKHIEELQPMYIALRQPFDIPDKSEVDRDELISLIDEVFAEIVPHKEEI